MSQPASMNIWEKFKIITGAAATVAIPIALAYVTNEYTKSMKEREVQGRFVELAVEILRENPNQENREIRVWATNIIDKYSGVNLSAEARDDLIERLPISATYQNSVTGFKSFEGNRQIEEIIILDTQNTDLESEVGALRKYNVSYHYIVGLDGSLFSLVDENNIAFHSPGRNSKSVGIGMLHKSGNEYTPEQINTLVELIERLIKSYNVPFENIVAASEISSDKRSDFPSIRDTVINRVQELL